MATDLKRTMAPIVEALDYEHFSEEKAPLLPRDSNVAEVTEGLKDFNAARKVLGG